MNTGISSMKVMERLMRICPEAKINAIPEKNLWEIVFPGTVYLKEKQPHIHAIFPSTNFNDAIKNAWETMTSPHVAIFVKGKSPWPSIMIVQWSSSKDDWENCDLLQIPIEKRERYRPKK